MKRKVEYLEESNPVAKILTSLIQKFLKDIAYIYEVSDGLSDEDVAEVSAIWLSLNTRLKHRRAKVKLRS